MAYCQGITPFFLPSIVNHHLAADCPLCRNYISDLRTGIAERSPSRRIAGPTLSRRRAGNRLPLPAQFCGYKSPRRGLESAIAGPCREAVRPREGRQLESES